MSITLDCPECDETLEFKEKYAGKRVRCPDCEEVIRVPSIDDEEEREARPRKRRKTGSRDPKKSATRKGRASKGSGSARKKRGSRSSARGPRRGPRKAEQEWTWHYSFLTGIMYGPIPVGIIIVAILGLLVAASGGLK